MTTPVDELRAAVEGHPGWHVDDEGVAVYQPTAAAAVVDRWRENFQAALFRGGRPTRAATFYSADEAVLLQPVNSCWSWSRMSFRVCYALHRRVAAYPPTAAERRNPAVSCATRPARGSPVSRHSWVYTRSSSALS